MAALRKEELARRIAKWLSRHHEDRRFPEAYDFDIKIHRLDIPDAAREQFSRERIEDIVQAAAENTLTELAEDLMRDFGWIRMWQQAGRSGGWLVLYTDEPVLDWRRDVINGREAAKRYRDLRQIEMRVSQAKGEFVRDIESMGFWHDYGVVGERRQDWRPSARPPE